MAARAAPAKMTTTVTKTTTTVTKRPKLGLCYGPDHKMGARVPHGGSSCANCRFGKMQKDGPHCMNPGWSDTPKAQGGGGGKTRLPVADPANYCCDLWAKK